MHAHDLHAFSRERDGRRRRCEIARLPSVGIDVGVRLRFARRIEAPRGLRQKPFARVAHERYAAEFAEFIDVSKKFPVLFERLAESESGIERDSLERYDRVEKTVAPPR